MRFAGLLAAAMVGLAGLMGCMVSAPDEGGDEALGAVEDSLKGGPTFCGGIAGFACPDGQVCVDDPRDGCDPSIGADCGGVCRKIPGSSGKGHCKRDATKTYVGTPSECPLIKFTCAEGSVYFSDSCGCGCETL